MRGRSHSFSSAFWGRAQAALLHRLQHGLFAKLNVDRKAQLSCALIQIAAEDDSLVRFDNLHPSNND